LIGILLSPFRGPSETPPCSDSDGDGVLDIDDNCPAWPNTDQSLRPWPIAVDDPDYDGWSTAEENAIGSDPQLACEAGTWPPALKNDQVVDFQDLNAIVPFLFQSASGNERTTCRWTRRSTSRT